MLFRVKYLGSILQQFDIRLCGIVILYNLRYFPAQIAELVKDFAAVHGSWVHCPQVSFLKKHFVA